MIREKEEPNVLKTIDQWLTSLNKKIDVKVNQLIVIIEKTWRGKRQLLKEKESVQVIHNKNERENETSPTEFTHSSAPVNLDDFNSSTSSVSFTTPTTSKTSINSFSLVTAKSNMLTWQATGREVANNVGKTNECLDDDRQLLDGLLVTKQRLNELKNMYTFNESSINVCELPAIEKKLFYTCCHRCLNTDPELFLAFICGVCKEKVWYCLHCLKYGRLTSCQSLYHLTIPKHLSRASKNVSTGFIFTSTLTPHQKQASDRIIEAIQSEANHLLIHAVCGAGKTEMLFHGINQALITGKRVAIATPRRDVIVELLPRFQQVFTRVPIICQYGGSEDNQKTSIFTLCTTHQLIRYKEAFDVLIIDEVDAFPYHNDVLLMKHAERALKETGTFIYLSATPRQTLLKKKYPTCFVPVRYHGHPLPVPIPYMSNFKRSPLPKNVYDAITQQQANHRQLLLFVATVKQADELLPLLKTTFPKLTIEAVHATSEKRKAHIDAFRLKSIDLLITTTILERGVTFPSVDVFVLHADHEVFDEAALVQIAGRAGRSKSDPSGWVHFYFDTYTRAIRQSIQSIKKMNALGGNL